MKRLVLLSIVIAISDQFTKQMMVRTLDQCGFGFCDSIDLLPFLKLVLLYFTEGSAQTARALGIKPNPFPASLTTERLIALREIDFGQRCVKENWA